MTRYCHSIPFKLLIAGQIDAKKYVQLQTQYDPRLGLLPFDTPEEQERVHQLIAQLNLVGGGGLDDPQRQIDQLALNQRWLIDQIDRIHVTLCPGQCGTWQQRAEQAVAAAKALKKS